MAENYLARTYDIRELSNITGIAGSDVSRYMRQSDSRAMRMYDRLYLHLGNTDLLLEKAGTKKKYKKKIKREGRGFVVKKDSLEDLISTIELITPDVLTAGIRKPESDKGSQDYIGVIEYSVKISPESRVSYQEGYTIGMDEVSRFMNDKKKDIEKEAQNIKRRLAEQGTDIRVEIQA